MQLGGRLRIYSSDPVGPIPGDRTGAWHVASARHVYLVRHIRHCSRILCRKRIKPLRLPSAARVSLHGGCLVKRVVIRRLFHRRVCWIVLHAPLGGAAGESGDFLGKRAHLEGALPGYLDDHRARLLSRHFTALVVVSGLALDRVRATLLRWSLGGNLARR